MSKKLEAHLDELPYKKVGKNYLFWKRFFDIFLSFIGIVVLSWLLLIIALLVICTSKGPAIYKDPRVGKDGKDIHVYKFRSMYIDAEDRIKKYLTKEQYETWLVERKIDHDPRVTKFGKFIRKTSIDELPQLFNILLGSMSIVGPRPITRRELDAHFTDEQKQILLSARPGLIGYWGVMGRSNNEFNNGVRQNLELSYFKLRGFWFDVGLIFRVIPVVFGGKGAY